MTFVHLLLFIVILISAAEMTINGARCHLAVFSEHT